MTIPKYLFGPVPSRRLGRSLGVDLTPFKTCSLDCIFCQLGRTTHQTIERRDYVPVQTVIKELEAWLAAGGSADHITLAGSGEPTLHAGFGEILDFIRSAARIPAVLLTNATLLHLPEVQQAAAQARIVKISLSAWDSASYGRVNRPLPELTFEQLIAGQKAFRRAFDAELWLEVFLVAGINSAPADVRRIAALAAEIQPDRIHLNTAVRPPAEASVVPLTADQLEGYRHFFQPAAEVMAEFSATESTRIRAHENTVMALLQRRPCTAEQIAAVFNLHLNEVSKYLGKLSRNGRILPVRKRGGVYYQAADSRPAPEPHR